MNKFNHEPLESPRAIEIVNIRVTVKALLKRAGVPSLLTDEQEKLARQLISEYDHISESLHGDPRVQGATAYDQQQREIGEGKSPSDAYTRDELIDEARTVLRANKARLVAITTEAIPILTEARARLFEVIEKVTAELDREGKEQADAFGIGWYQSNLTVGVIRDLKRRLERIVPPEGAARVVRALFEFCLDGCEPVVRRDALAVREEEKRSFLSRAADAIKQAVAGEEDRRAAEIQKANAPKEARKRELAAAGVIRLGSDGK